MKKLLVLMLCTLSFMSMANSDVVQVNIPEKVLTLNKALCPELSSEELYTEVMDVGHGKTIYLLTCELYAYNSMSRAYMVNSLGDVSVLSVMEIDYRGEMYATNSLMGGSLDIATKSLNTFSKGRGMGDCGQTATYSYDSDLETFVLKEYRLKATCDGEYEDEWPVIYPTQAK